MTVKIIKHPLIDHYMNLLRSKDTKSSDFRVVAKLISKLMGYEIFKNLKSQDAKIKTPLDKFEGRELQKPFPCLVSILRAGSIIVEGDVIELLDNKSTNGIFLNGELIEKANIKSGDRIQVGKFLLLLVKI